MEKELKLMKIENESNGNLSQKRKMQCSLEVDFNESIFEGECICNVVASELENEQNRLKICIIYKLKNCTPKDVLLLKKNVDNPKWLWEELDIISLIEKAVNITERAILQ